MNYSGKFDAKLPADGSGLHSTGHGHVETISSHATHAPSDAIIVPDAQLLFNGDFKRSGVDLVLTKDDHELVLQDYFKGEKRAALSSPDGAHLTGDIVNALTGHVEYAQADGSASVGKVIGHVTKLAGTATATRNGVSIILNQGDNVEKGDVVQSGSNSTLGLTFIDGTVFGLSSNARMVLNEMVYDPNGSNNSSLLSLVAGTITFVAGETAKHGDMKIDTPVATMGIRGTAVLVEIDFQIPLSDPTLPSPLPLPPSGPAPPPPPAPTATFQVLVEPDGTTGSYILFDKITLLPLLTVDKAGQVVSINNGNVSVGNGLLSPDVQKLITDVFSMKFTSTDTNTKLAGLTTDTLTPQALAPFITPNGTIAIPLIVNVQTAEKATPSNPTGTPPPSPHIDRPPDAAATSNAFVELAHNTGSSAIDTVSGKVNFADINAGDLPTVSAKFASFTYQNAAHHDVTSTLNAQQLADILAVEAKLFVTQDAGNNNNGSASWTYSVADGAFDFLAAGETLVLNYLGLVDNNYTPNEAVTPAPFTITITGTDDAPTIAATSAALAEHSGIVDHAGGTITFADVDLTDRPVVSTAFSSFTYRDSHGNDVALTPGQQAAIAAVEASLTLTPSLSNANNGSVTWSYDVADSELGFLADGDTLTLTYLASVDDGHGGLTHTPVTVTILGVSDVPHLITELAGHTGDTTDSDTASGTLPFTGVDLNNIESVAPSLVSATWSGGSVLPSGLASTLASSFTASVTSSVGFTFSATDNNFDFLADGETLAVIYAVTIVDNHGLSSTRPVTIIITGTEDAPTIVADSTTATGGVTEDTNVVSGNIGTSGTIAFQDLDLTDTHTATFALESSTSSAHLPGFTDNTTNIGTFALTAVSENNTDTTNTASLGWTFTLDDSNSVLQSLAVGEIITQVYTVTVSDGHGGTVPQDVTVTITGTEDAPTIVAGSTTATGAIGEIAATTGSTTLDSATGSIAFADVDLIDSHTVNQAAPTFAWSGGTLSAGQITALTSASTLALTETDSTGTGSGSVAWNYSAQDKTFDFLATGQTLKVTYAVTVADTHGGTTTQNVVVTITGTNDAAVISGTSSGSVEVADDGPGSGTATATGTLTDTDVDNAANTFTAVTTATASDHGYGTFKMTAGGVWTYTLDNSNSAVRALGEGHHLTDTFTVHTVDGTAKVVTVTINDDDPHSTGPAGVAGSEINLGLAAVSPDPGSLVTVTVADLPSGWSLKGGVQVDDHTWTIQTSDVQSLTVTTSSASLGAVVLEVSESWTNPDGQIASALVVDNVESYAVGAPIFAWTANDYLTGSSGSDLFVFAQPISRDVIYSFDVASDKIDLVGFGGFSDFNDVATHLSDDGAGNTVLTLASDETITLHGVSSASLSAVNFQFDQQTVLVNSADMIIGNGATLPLSGMIENTGVIQLNSTGGETDLDLIQSGATLHGGGQIVLSDSDANIISGTNSSVTLNNEDNTISGAGQLGNGELALINAGTINATGTHVLTIDTGSNIVSNSGVLEATGTGGLTVESAIANSGILWANGAAITVLGEVSGNGTAQIDGNGTLDFEASSTANVVFGAGAAGALKLGDSFDFKGTISGFAGSDTIDLADVGSSTTSISYHENAAGTGGTLAISDGVHTVELSLLGQYSADNFSIVPDHATGTFVTYVPHDLMV